MRSSDVIEASKEKKNVGCMSKTCCFLGWMECGCDPREEGEIKWLEYLKGTLENRTQNDCSQSNEKD